MLPEPETIRVVHETVLTSASWTVKCGDRDVAAGRERPLADYCSPHIEFVIEVVQLGRE